ncbi:MAG: adenosyl-hopene transferase HpnH, partial [Planctomycetaceae bacterium]
TDCMVHCGYEPTAVSETFGSLKGLAAAARLTLFGPRDEEPEPDPPRRPPLGHGPKIPAKLYALDVPQERPSHKHAAKQESKA